MTRPTIAFWKTGKKSAEQGWKFDERSFTLDDLKSVRSFVDLQSKGVPQNICVAARNAGYAPSELSDFLSENGYK